MKTVLLAPLPPPSGGIASWAKRMMHAQLKNGWETVIVDEKVIGDRDVFGGSVKMSMSTEIKRCFGIWKRLCAELKDKDVKVVHSSIPAGFTGMLREWVCALITKLHRRKFIIHFRCTLPNMVKDGKTLLMFKLLLSLSDAVIALNTPSEDFVKKYFPRKRVELIPNFVSLDEAATSDRQEKDSVTVTYIGGVIEEKGCADILLCAERTPSVNYRLVGAIGEDMRDKNLPSNVIFCGETNKNGVLSELSQADIFMFVTFFRGEGFSNALAEAMANKLPCIVSDWAANADMIEDKGGITVALHDIDAMAEAVEKLAGDSALRRQMGEWNFEKVTKYYSQKCVTDRYVDLYESIV